MKIIILFLLVSNLCFAQIRDKKSKYFEISLNARDFSKNLSINHQIVCSFVSVNRLKIYKKLNFIYDNYQFKVLKLVQTVPVERFIANYSIEFPIAESASNRSYIGVEVGGGLGYEQVNRGVENIQNFTLKSNSSVVGTLQTGLNLEHYISRSLVIGIKNGLIFSPNSTLQRITFANGISFKFKVRNTK